MKKIAKITLTVFLALTLFSCKSKPEAEETPAQAPVIEDTDEELAKHEDETQQSNTEAVIKVNTEELISRLNDARNVAVEAGAQEFASQQLAQIDALFEELKRKESFSEDETSDLEMRYNTLTNYVKAKSAKQKIDENELALYNQSSYNKGLENLTLVEDAYSNESATSKEILQAANDAYSDFNSVLISAYKSLAMAERKEALNAKKSADEVKAGVSRKEQYAEATQYFKDGDSLYSMQSPEKALNKYASAKNLYSELAADVKEKRSAALAAIEAAKKRVAESEHYAEEADAKTPIAEPIEGIEEENAVLLEADNYENPDDAVIEVDATIGEEENSETAGAENQETAGEENPVTTGEENPETADEEENPETAGEENPVTTGTENPETAGAENPETADEEAIISDEVESAAAESTENVETEVEMQENLENSENPESQEE